MNSQSRKRRDEAVDTIRTIYWFEGLRNALGSKSPRAIQRAVEPTSIGNDARGEPIRNNKWRDYAHGLHVPRKLQVSRAEAIVAGSSRELNHILWEILRTEARASDHARDWLRQLAPEIQLIVFGKNDQFHMHGGRHFLGKLERRASMDALACLTVLLRVNHERDDHERVWEYAESIFRVLLMLGHHLDERKIANTLFGLYVVRIFSLARWNGLRFYVEKYRYVCWSLILYRLAEVDLESTNPWAGWHELVLSMWKMLCGDFDSNLRIQLEPLIGADIEIGPPTEKNFGLLEQNIRLRNWRLNNLRSHVIDRPPTEDLLPE